MRNPGAIGGNLVQVNGWGDEAVSHHEESIDGFMGTRSPQCMASQRLC
jgi:hypothetical protein